MTGFTWDGGKNKLGDQICRTSLPENFFKNTGDKLINFGVPFFENNPYVIHSESVHPNTLSRVEKRSLWNYTVGNVCTANSKTMAHEICKNWGLEKTYLTKPRLYIYEEIKPYPRSLVINTTGSNQGAIPLHVLNMITEKYKKTHWITQIGSVHDIDCECDSDARGKTWQESARIIAESEIFIGVCSFCMWLANCYNIRKKIILVNKNKERCENFWPRVFTNEHLDNPFDTWIEWSSGLEVYNTFKEDLGMTRSYLEI